MLLLALVVALAATVTVPAGASHGGSTSFPGASWNGWYGSEDSPLEGSIEFRVRGFAPSPRLDGDIDQILRSVTCSGHGVSGGLSLPEDSYKASDTTVWVTVTGESLTKGGTTVFCSARYSTRQWSCSFWGCSSSDWSDSIRTHQHVLKIDTTPPEVTMRTTTQPNDAGWYRDPGHVSVSGTDLLSGILRCSAPVAYGASDGVVQGQLSCFDLADNITTVPYRIPFDGTPPQLSPTVTPAVVPIGGTVEIGPGAVDSYSGVATMGCDDADTSLPGTHTVICSATDKAGNATSQEVEYTVATYVFSGFDEPVRPGAISTVKAGSTLPLRWAVADHLGEPVDDLTSVSLSLTPVACDEETSGEELETVSSGSTGLRHHGEGRYQYNWKTPNSLSGSCGVLHLDLGDGLRHSLELTFR